MTPMECEPIDPEISEVVDLLRDRGVETFSSCSGGEGHTWIYPMVRCRPCDPVWLFSVLVELGYDGFYVKAYRSAHVGPQVDFIEVEFWSLDCLNRKLTSQKLLNLKLMKGN